MIKYTQELKHRNVQGTHIRWLLKIRRAENFMYDTHIKAEGEVQKLLL